MATRRKTSTKAEPGDNTDFLARLTNAITDHFGDQAVMRLSDAKLYSLVKDYVSICWGVDFAMHLPGAPCGRLTTIVGAEASAKTTLAMAMCAETQRRGGIAVYIDTEYALDVARCRLLGVDVEKMIVAQPETTEEAIGVLKDCIKMAQDYYDETGEDKLITIVIDSCAGAPTKAELDAKDDEGIRAGGHAALYSVSLRKVMRDIAKHRIALVIVNQEKEKLSFTGFAKGDSTKTMIAARPLNFHSSVILTTHQIEIVKDSKKTPIGIRTRVRVKKNKNAAPYSEADVYISFKTGIDNEDTILSLAALTGIINKDRSWYVYEANDGTSRKFQSGSFSKVLEEYPEIMVKMNELKNSLAAQDAKAEDEDAAVVEDDDEPDDEDEG